MPRGPERTQPRVQRGERLLGAGAIAVWLAAALLVALTEIVDRDFGFHLALGRILLRDFGSVRHLVLGQSAASTLFAYSYWLKRQVLVDVFVIATGFDLRAIAGVELLLPVAPATALSPWLLVCTFFGALFLALAKRRREIENSGARAGDQRAVLEHYSPELLEGLLTITATASLMSYALYTIWPATVAKFGTEALLYTVPFVAYGIFRYLYLTKSSEKSEDPSQVLLTDRPMAVCVVLYLITVLAVLYRP